MRFHQQRILITGGSRGIGRAIVQAFAESGGYVAFTYVSHEEAARETLESIGTGPHISICADISDPQAAQYTVAHTIEELGGLDILVHNAGVYIPHDLKKVSYEEWQRVWQQTMNINLLGPANLTFCTAQHMIKTGEGKIVAVSSRGAFRGEPTHPAYGASKAGLNAFSQSLAQALAPSGITVGIVAPGYVYTDMTAEELDSPEGKIIRAQSPLNRVATPKEIARAVLFLADKGNEFTTGTIIDVNGASFLRA